MRSKIFIAAICLFAFVRMGFAQSNEFRLVFHKGDFHRVVTTEILRIQMHFPQVDPHDALPSVRTTVYSFTDRVDSVLPGGSAIIAASLDSFKTGIDMGEGPHAENFFRFNSSGDWDITHELHDIKVLPRAQFLGQTIRFVMRPDGTISQFLNLDDFHNAATSMGYDYDVLHAMLALSDSLRMGQLLEYGAGAFAASKMGTYTSPFTTTEIPIRRTVTATPHGSGTLDIHVRYDSAPARVEYLEGIAMPLYILHYYGAGDGNVTIKDHYLKHSFYEDTAIVLLHVDIDTVPENITRTVTTDVYPISVLHGGRVMFREGASGIDSTNGFGNQPKENPHGQNGAIVPMPGEDTTPARKNSEPNEH